MLDFQYSAVQPSHAAALSAPPSSRVLASKKQGQESFRRGTEPIPFFLGSLYLFCEPMGNETCEPHPHACGLRLGEKGLSHSSFLGLASYHHLLPPPLDLRFTIIDLARL